MCGTECWTDYRLLISKMNLRVAPPSRPQGIIVSKWLNVSKLKSGVVKEELAGELESKLQSHNTNPDADVEIEWACIHDAVYATASAVVGPTTRKHQDWFDDNNSRIKSILEEKNPT